MILLSLVLLSNIANMTIFPLRRWLTMQQEQFLRNGKSFSDQQSSLASQNNFEDEN